MHFGGRAPRARVLHPRPAGLDPTLTPSFNRQVWQAVFAAPTPPGPACLCELKVLTEPAVGQGDHADRTAPVRLIMRWSKLNQEELMALLLAMGLPAHGTKKELARRLGQHIQSLPPPPPELVAANADSNSRRKAIAASAAATTTAKTDERGSVSQQPSSNGPASDAAVSELLGKEGNGGTGRSGRSGGRRNRIHPRNWGYTTYLDRVFGMRCFNDLVRLRVFPDAKDISESYGALQAAARYGGICDPSGAHLDSRGAERRKGVLCINIGDGATPRTAALAAYLTAWNAVSVDPAMRSGWQGKHPEGIARLWSYGMKFEEWAADPSGAMSDVGAQCVQGSELEHHEVSGQMALTAEKVALADGSDTVAAAEEAASAEAKASIAYIKASPLVRAAWISWLEEQPRTPADASAQNSEESDPTCAPVRAARRGGSGLASIGFDPVVHTQVTRARFCAEHQKQTATPAVDTSDAEQEQLAAVPAVASVAHLVLICVHAHNRFTGVAAMERIRASYGFPPTVLVSLPCCHQFNPTNDLGRPPDEDFEDLAIFSACRRVLVWRWQRGPEPKVQIPKPGDRSPRNLADNHAAAAKRVRRPPAEENAATGAELNLGLGDAGC